MVDLTTSTQIDLADLANAGLATKGDVIAAEFQSGGRGRLDRKFDAPAGSALLFSFYITPKRSRNDWGFLSHLAALCMSEIISNDLNIAVSLKWPNDILIAGKKVCGLIAQATADGIIIGIGLNVGMENSELPVTHATSLAIAKFDQLDRNVILPELLKSLAANIGLWENGSDLPLGQYRQASSTMGKEVEVHLPSGEILKSQALGINEIGELQLASGVLVNVGDVRHLR